MTKIPKQIFRTYDIRGVYEKEITPQLAEIIGKGFGTFIGGNKEIVVSHDVRRGNEPLKEKLIEGLTATGNSVIDIGLAPTPLLYFAIIHYKTDGGISITASHNPAEWNGFKLCGPNGIIYSDGTGLEEIKKIILKQKFSLSVRKGKIERNMTVFDDYSELIMKKLNIEKKLKVVLDTGNSVSGLIAPKLFRQLGFEVQVLNEKLDSEFSGRGPEPTSGTLQELSKEVVKRKADFGVGFDSDGDRAVFVSNRGEILKADFPMIIFTKDILTKQKNAKIVFDLYFSSAVEETIRKNQGVPILEKNGRSFIMDRMKKEDAALGGEISNHFYFSDISGLDDGIYAGLKMAEILSESDQKLSGIVDSIPEYYTSPIKNIPCLDEKKYKIVRLIGEKLKNQSYRILEIDGVKVFDDGGWFLIRASNTQPFIRINAEAKTKEKLNSLLSMAEKLVHEELRRD